MGHTFRKNLFTVQAMFRFTKFQVRREQSIRQPLQLVLLTKQTTFLLQILSFGSLEQPTAFLRKTIISVQQQRKFTFAQTIYITKSVCVGHHILELLKMK